MNDTLIEQLLNEEESSLLDFKKEQYLIDFSGLSYTKEQKEEKRSEFIKDILAFANATFAEKKDAYILIGVQEIRGGRSIPNGISKHFDDATLHQIVNSKTRNRIKFSYKAFSFEGVQLGIIQIPVQEQFTFLSSNYGKLKGNVVYIRDGSSTDEVRPDEIAQRAKNEEEINRNKLFLQPIFDAHGIGSGSLRLTLWNRGETIKNISIEWFNGKLPKAAWAKDEQIEIDINKATRNQFIFPFSINYEDKLGNKFRKKLSYDLERIGLSEIETQEIS